MSENIDIRWACLSHVGNVRPNNEDSMVMLQVEEAGGTTALESKGAMILPSSGCVAAVADGMGGVEGGEMASSTARIELLEKLGSQECPTPHAAYLQELINSINFRILDEAEENPSLAGMGTTLTLAWFHGKTLTLAHVGDSRLYRFRNNTLEQLSEDQSPVGKLLREGRITIEEAHNHPSRNVIDQAVGSHPDGITADVGDFPVEDDDLFLLCSDGLNEEVWDHEMTDIIQEGLRTNKPLLGMTEDLVSKALLAGGKDNVTVLLVQIQEQDN